MDYCAEGSITTTESTDPETDDPVREIRFDLGEIFVCDSTLEHTPENDAAFKQDDTPSEFHGRFVSFVAGAVETTAVAAECPTDELERYGEEEFTNFATERLADRFAVPESDVEVVPGTIGSSDRETREELREALESYANLQDPDNPDVEYEALSISYLSADGSAVDDSCYRSPGGRDLDDLDSVTAPEPGER